MPTPLTRVDVWKARALPTQRVIPPHLKLAILSRGHVLLPTQNVQWLLHIAEQRGASWVGRLTADLWRVFPKLPVTVELFLNQRLSMTNGDIDTTLQAYLSLRHAKYLSHCRFLLFAWATHEENRQKLETLLDVDLALLYSRPQVHLGPGDERRYILLTYVCLPHRIVDFIAPQRGQPAPSPLPLMGMTSVSTRRMLRTDPDPARPETERGEQTGDAVHVEVLEKRLVPYENENLIYYRIRLQSDLKVKGEAPILKAGNEYWIVRDGLAYVAAPWTFFRQQLVEFETKFGHLSLDDRITKLRQWSEDSGLHADDVIGTRQGEKNEYQDTRPFEPGVWQIAKDYETVLAPDGRIVEIKHLLSGLDVLRRQPKEKPAGFRGVNAGMSYGVVTWSGDLGAAAANMALRVDEDWESDNSWAGQPERADHYFVTRAAEFDLLADLDVWGIHALRASDLTDSPTSIDSLLALYYENTQPGELRTLTAGRKGALERFLKYYGFTYKYDTDIGRYPVFLTQSKPMNRIRNEIEVFANAWFKREQVEDLLDAVQKGRFPQQQMPLTTNDALLVRKHTDAMTALFLYWLEYQTIENGVEVLAPGAP